MTFTPLRTPTVFPPLLETPDSSQRQTSSSNGLGGCMWSITSSCSSISSFLLASSYDLSNIMAAVSTISGQWKELGSGLGLQPAILDAIQGPPEVCMVEVIKHWVHGAMAASRQRLSSVLMRMGRADLAEGMMAGVERGKEQHGHWVLMALFESHCFILPSWANYSCGFCILQPC